jgi:hypothetical protein
MMMMMMMIYMIIELEGSAQLIPKLVIGANIELVPYGEDSSHLSP